MKTIKNYAPQILAISAVVTRILEIASYVFIGLFSIGGVAVLAIPKDLLVISLDDITRTNITLGQISVSVASLGLSGEVTLKWLILLGILFVGVMLICGAIIFKNLRQIIYDVKDGDPFHDENATRLYKMGTVAIIASIIVPIFAVMFQSHLIHLIDYTDATVNYGINLTYLFVGFLLIVLGSIFEKGHYLQQEFDQTV